MADFGRRPRILVSVICYNEEKSIGAALQDLQRSGLDYDVVVIDNGSFDDTAKVARAHESSVISHCVNSGASTGTQMSYFVYAYRNDYDVLCQFDGDGQHLAAELPKIVGPILEGRANCVIGSRFIEKKGFQSTVMRRVGIRLFSAILSRIMNQRLTDVTSGFRAYDRRMIEFFGKTYRQQLHDAVNQFILISHFAGFTFLEVPVLMRPREAGVSEFNFRNSILFPIKSLAVIVGTLLQRDWIRRHAR